MSNHTPGPWVVEAGKFEGYVIRESGVENPINPGTGWRFVVDPIDGDSKAHKRVHFGAIAREDEARLIAAAPEMLEALERTLWYVEKQGRRASTVAESAAANEAAQLLQSVIAKAKGESNE